MIPSDNVRYGPPEPGDTIACDWVSVTTEHPAYGIRVWRGTGAEPRRSLVMTIDSDDPEAAASWLEALAAVIRDPRSLHDTHRL